MKGTSPPAIPSNRSFGITIAVIFGLIGLVPLASSSPMRLWALEVAGALLLVSFVVPQVLTWPNRLWMGFGRVAGRITNPIVLGLVFFLFVTPLSLVLKLFRNDLLSQRLDRKADTYWSVVEEQPSSESMRRQF